mmetsp:Transcript_11911/g.19388  ORF Transcript_11911/g.19388 Transcript_11911/m.19388 type:complete len:214 (-) Transcript_11911:603-1244(-)
MYTLLRCRQLRGLHFRLSASLFLNFLRLLRDVTSTDRRAVFDISAVTITTNTSTIGDGGHHKSTLGGTAPHGWRPVLALSAGSVSCLLRVVSLSQLLEGISVEVRQTCQRVPVSRRQPRHSADQRRLLASALQVIYVAVVAVAPPVRVCVQCGIEDGGPRAIVHESNGAGLLAGKQCACNFLRGLSDLRLQTVAFILCHLLGFEPLEVGHLRL